MELAADTRLIAQYSPTSTPILDVLRPVPHESHAKLSAGEYFFLCSAVILVLIGLQDILRVLETLGSKPPALALIGLLIPACCLGAAALVHELGHLVAGKIAGFRFAGLNLSSFAGSNSYEGRKLDACQVLPLGILVLEPGKTDRLPRRLTVLLLGGPLASLLTPLVLEASQYWAQHFLLNVFLNYAVHVFTAVSILLGLAALLPDVSRRGNFSDGARLLMLAKKDELAARWLAILELQLALGRGEHPRKWDESSVFRATAVHDGSRDAVTAMWLAYLWASERQDITSATRYLEDALAAPRASSAWLRDRLFVEAAVFQAWFRDNPGKARSWVVQIHGSKLTPLQQQRLNIALLWAEGRLFDAWEKTAECFRLLAAMPDSPARDLAKQSVEEWKRQMESRMLTRAWRTMYSLSHQMDAAVRQTELSSS